MKIHNIPQRSDRWRALRLGKPTASNFERIITAQGKRSGQARKYMYQLAWEQIANQLWERDLSNVPAVKHGIDNEDRAAAAFEHHSGLATDFVGFITDDAESMGCSPDRIIAGRNEALEIKCPQGPTMCGYLIDGLEDAYKAQTQGEILIGQYDRVHFFAWSAELPPYYKIIEPDREFQSLLWKYLLEFNQELIRGVAHIRALGHWPRNAPSVFPDEDTPDDVA